MLTYDLSTSKWISEPPSSSFSATRTTYDFVASAGQTVYTIAYTNAENVDVFMNGILMDGGGDQYTLSGNNTLTLEAGASSGDKILVYDWDNSEIRVLSEYVATEGQSVFNVTFINMVMTDVYINGLLYSPDQYTLTGGTTLTLENSLQAGDLLKFYVWPAYMVYSATSTNADTLSGYTSAYHLDYDNFTNTPTIPNLVVDKTDITATAGQTSFTANYSILNVDVFLNGIKVRPTEYTATNGTSVVFHTGVEEDSWVQVVSIYDN